MSSETLRTPIMGSRVESYKEVTTRLGLVIALTLAVAHAQTQAPVGGPRPGLSAGESTAPTTSQSPRYEEHLISPEDVLEVYVFDVPELSRDYVVNAKGEVTVPLLPNPVRAAGLTTEGLARELEQSFQQTGRLSRPQITVTIKQSRRSAVTVEGAVKVPQVVPVIGPTRLVSILSQCGGLADDAGSTATITRSASVPGNSEAGAGPASSATKIELKKLMDVNDPTAETLVYPGDRVAVERAGVFYVLGEVNRPGGYNLKNAEERVTILEALSIAGDVTSIAKKSQVRIIRKDTTTATGRHELAVNVDDILTGRSPDLSLQADDILFVPVSGGKRALHTLTSTGMVMAGAAGTTAIYRR